MAQIKSLLKRIVLLVIMISIIITFCAVPSSYAKLTIQEGEYYYAGTQKGSYVPSVGIFSWLLNALSELADFLLGIITMGIRMAFVGYTALAEQLLTWALESTAGINVAGEDVGVSATNWIDDLSNSSDNVTVQAIVYNMVPALNSNFFDTEYDSLYYKTITETDDEGNKTEKQIVVSPTGKELICKKCKKSVLECCTDWEEGDTEIKCYAPSAGDGKADCGCNGCADCEKYALLKTARDPIIIQLKTLIAVWYYIIRLLAVAAMCVVLIIIGIKMAVSTVASDRAVYKRMLVDWLVGIILIFTMHYVMYFTVTVNEILIDTVRNSANSINKVQLKELADTSKDEEEVTRSNQELEINIYEEIRTRAYDPKLTVGLSGMIMYITLVFMAIKYTLVYLKRFLTLAVLTLMAPGLGVSYAIQKALSGKSSSLKSWFTEYILNTLIQVVHALIYAIFISAALVFSLQNISGIIVALILMNFSLSAEKIFRKIFNLDAGNKGLLGATETAGDKDKWQKNMKTIKGLAVGAKPVTNALMFPGKLVAGTAVRGIGTGAAVGISMIANRNKYNKNNVDVEDTTTIPYSRPGSRENGEGEAESEEKPREKQPKDQPTENKEKVEPQSETGTRRKINEDDELRAKGEEVLMQELAKAEEEYIAHPEDEKKRINVLEKNRRLKRYREVLGEDKYNVTTRDVVVGHIKGAFDIKNYFDLKFDENGKIIKSTPKKGLVFGTLQYNSAKGKFEVNKSNRTGTYFNVSNLLGFSDQDKKIFKEKVVTPSLKVLTGMASMFIGMGNLVAHPLEGMTAMTVGYAATHNMMKSFKRPKKGAPGRFKFNRFTTPTVRHMSDNIVRQANRELAESITKNVKVKHPTLWKNIKNDHVKAKTILPIATGVAAGVAFGVPVGITSAVFLRRRATDITRIADRKSTKIAKKEYKNRYDPYGIEAEHAEINPYPMGTTAYDLVDMQHYKQLKEQIVKFEDDAHTLIGEREQADAEIHVRKYIEEIDDALDKELQEQALIQYWLIKGYEYDPKTRRTVRIQEVQKTDIKDGIKVRDKAQRTSGKLHTRDISKADIQKINKRIDEVIASQIKGEELEINSEKAMDDILKDLSLRLQSDGILEKNQSVTAVFAREGRLKTIIKDKAETANGIVRNEIAKTLELNSEELDAVQQAVSEVAKESATSDDKNVDLSKIDQAKVLNKVQEKLGIQQVDATSEETDRRDVTSTVDRLDQNANTERYKGAISALLSEKIATDGTSESSNLIINIDDKDAINNVLLSQADIDPIQIRDRLLTGGVLARGISEIAPVVNVMPSPNASKNKKQKREKILDIIDKCSKKEVDVTDSSGETVKKPMSTEEKLEQAKAALSDLGFLEGSVEREKALESLLAISNMQENLEALNVSAESKLASTSKFRKKPKKSYMQAVIELSDARQKVARAKQKELYAPTSKKEDIRKEIAELDEKVKQAERVVATAGPVKDVKSATKSVLKALKENN